MNSNISFILREKNWDDFTRWLTDSTSIIQWGVEVYKTYQNLGKISHISDSVGRLWQIVNLFNTVSGSEIIQHYSIVWDLNEWP